MEWFSYPPVPPSLSLPSATTTTTTTNTTNTTTSTTTTTPIPKDTSPSPESREEVEIPSVAEKSPIKRGCEGVRYLNQETHSPVLFVVDFDNTLAVYDMKKLLQIDFMDNLPSVYTRPFLHNFLTYIRSVNRHNILILWTAGTQSYIHRALILCDIAHYFHHILTYSDCKESQIKYGLMKAYRYIIEKYPQYSDMRSVIIDNFAMRNATHRTTNEKTYSKIYSVLPYTIRTVVEMYGAFNVPPILINDIDTFIRTKGLYGVGPPSDSSAVNPFIPKYGDTVLLSVIQILEQDLFTNDLHKPVPVVVKTRPTYVIREAISTGIVQPFLWTIITD